MEKCLICEQSLTEGETSAVLQRGKESLIQASLKRNDFFHLKLEPLTIPFLIHVSCRRDYTRDSSIKAYVNKKLQSQPSASPSDFITRSRRSDDEDFDFKKQCLYCAEVIPPVSGLSLKIRKNVREVQTLEVREAILRRADERKDKWGTEVAARLRSVIDLVAAEARYHVSCSTRFGKSTVHSHSGRPVGSLRTAFEKLCEYIEGIEDAQFSLQELMDKLKELSESGDFFSEKYLEQKLSEYFGDRLTISFSPRKSKIFTMTKVVHKLITDKWYTERLADPQEEELRIVRMAGSIIGRHIQKKTFEREYPNSSEIEEGGTDLVPKSLQVFLEEVTKKSHKDADSSPKLARKRKAVSHIIISLCRPRTFISPILYALGIYFTRMYGSKHLIKILYSLGFCPSYTELEAYQQSLIRSGTPEIDPHAYVQYAFDNADVNVRTLDGLDTFHALGGIKCITPKSAVHVTSNASVPRDTSQNIASGNFSIPVLNYAARRENGLEKLSVKEISELTPKVLGSTLNFLWLSGFVLDVENIPGWSGFMHTVFNNEAPEYETSYILALPFINVDPGNPSAIFSALSFVATQCVKLNKKCIVTCDQPIYLKAAEILASAGEQSDLENVIVRLGGFHLLMSFLGCMGKFMEGSGVEELWKTVYGSATVPHLLSGKAYSRSVRAHMLTQVAVMILLCDEDDFKSLFNEELSVIYAKVLSGEVTPEQISSLETLNDVMVKFNDRCDRLIEQNRTAKLWLQELHLVDVLFRFLLAERTGDWQLHLNTVHEMLPFFHAAGHLPYAKSARLYYQQMAELETKLSPEEFQQFCHKGFFTIRRTDKFFTGTSPDMCIEQTLMKNMKSIGGLTHGRGLSENTLMKFIHGAPAFVNISEAFQSFTGVTTGSSEQHTELRVSRRERDMKDAKKIVDWLRVHSPFNRPEKNELVCIATGTVANGNVNCDTAYEVGLKSMKTVSYTNFGKMKLKRKDTVKPLSTVKTGMSISTSTFAVNPEQLFNRVVCAMQGREDLKTYFRFELSPFPTSLFENNYMFRRGTKSSIVKEFEVGLIDDKEMPRSPTYVLDGGNLLHSITWSKGSTYNDIFYQYLAYVNKNFGTKVSVVFDGYTDYPTTKQIEHQRRAKRTSVDIHLEPSLPCTVQQSHFLGNTNNKKRLISYLVDLLRNHGIKVKVAVEDADVDIVEEVISIAKSTTMPTILIARDTDLLMLLLGREETDSLPIYMKMPTKIFDIKKLSHYFKNERTSFLFLHAMTGCDTTSAFYGKGKNTALHFLTRNKALCQKVAAFNEISTTKEEVTAIGEEFILHWYGLSKYNTLDEARYHSYLNKVSKMSLKSKFEMATLPPTSSAAKMHSLRVYFQVQRWLGNENIIPSEWGWKLDEGILIPIHSEMDVAPPEIMHQISCNCKKGCSRRCSCVRAGLLCSDMCGDCNGISCTNSIRADGQQDIEDVDFDETVETD